jgi:hypothetical protein
MKTSVFTHYEQIILDNIDFEGYNLSNDVSRYDKVKTLYNIFKREYVHENNKHLKEVVLFAKWLQGLPTVLSVPFYNFEILESGLLAGYDLSDETKEEIFLANYWLNLSNAFFTLKENL